MLFLVRQFVGSTGLQLALRLILLLGLPPGAVFAFDGKPRQFAFSEAAAEVTLETFSDQTGAQVVYLIEDVHGVTTNSLRGFLAPREALERLVAGTGLKVVQDGGSGAFVIKRDRTVRPPAEAQAKQATEAPQTMKKSLTARLAAALGAVATSVLSAQTAPLASTTLEPKKDEVVVLSPFTVSTDRDVGFVAASSLAGGRMATDLKDTPLAYSVLTKEFLEALAITDTETAMDWAVNSYQARGDVQDRIQNLDGGTRTRARGVIVKQLRNFFAQGVLTDVCAQDRIDFARGTNALLIGNGGLGGATVLMTKQATFDKRKGELALSFSDQGTKRATLDFNQPIGDKVAFRASFLKEDSDTWRDNTRSRRDGVYLTASARPWKKTRIRADYEDYKSKELLGVNGLNDRVSGWDGITVVNAPIGTLPGGVNSNAVGIERVGSSTSPYMLILPGYNNSTVYNFANTWRTMGGGATTATPVDGILPVTTSSLGAAGSRITGVQNEPLSRFDIATSKSKFFVPAPSYVYLPDLPYTFSQVLRNKSVYLDQQIGDDFFLQVAHSATLGGRLTNLAPQRFTEVYVDVNRTLPDGKTNPYYLEPFVETTRDDRGEGLSDTKETRAAIGYVKENTRLGSFRLNVMGGLSEVDTTNRTYTYVMARNPDIRQRPVNDSPGYRYYLNDPNRPYGFPSQVTYVDSIAGTSSSYQMQDLLNLNYTDANNRTAERHFDYVQASAFAKLFKDRLVLLAGKRWDRFRVQTWNALHTNTRAAYPTDWDGRTLLHDPDAPANYWSLTSTQRGLYNPPILDQKVSTNSYGGIINATKWLGGFYNFAQTYDTSRVVLAINGNVLEPTVSKGWDAGIRFSLLDGRINSSISKYGTTATHTATGADRNEIGILTRANALNDLSVDGINARGLGLVPQPYQDYQDAWANGYEFEVVANVTKDWRLTMNYALPENYSNNRYPETLAYWAANKSALRQIVLDTGAVIDATTNLASNPGIATSASPDITTAISNWNSMQTFISTAEANAPIVSTAYKYTANIYTDYRFSEGRLKNLRIGGGVQFRSKIQLGNRGSDTIVNPANPLTAIDDPTVDANTPVYMEAWHMATATIGYEMKVWHDMRLSLNLNVSNLLDRKDQIYNAAGLRPKNGDIASPARVMSMVGYYPDPRTFRLTARLNF
jgi:outer membrane receptor for ferric coprogen and ferric-rhodotorulic acid